MKMMKTFFASLSCALALASLLPAAYAETPPADVLLAAMREMTVSQGERDVAGNIRKGRTKIPFSLSSRGDTIVYQYKQGDAWQRFDVRMKSKGAELYLLKPGNKAEVMAPANYGQSIPGTDVSYEDLSMRFLYWKGGRVIEDSADSRIKGQDCYIIEVPNPDPKVGQYAWVRIWVDKENGTAWQIDGYGADGKLKKRFSITSVQRLSDGTWFFKQMKLEVRNPQNPDRTIALDYLEMDDLPKGK